MTTEDLDRVGNLESWLATLFIASMATLVHAFLEVKLFLLGLFLLAVILNVSLGRTRIVLYRPLLWFYLLLGLAGTGWVLVGALHHNNSFQGYWEAFRLYVIWNGAFLVLYTLIRNQQSLRTIHRSLVLAGILVPLINLVGLYDQFNGLGLISESARKELGMEIGFGNGYVQYSTVNIEMLFLIVPYLLSLQLRTDAREQNSKLAKVALVLSLVLAVLSGRRALWLVIAFTPFTVLLVSWITDSLRDLKPAGRRLLFVWAAATVLAFVAILGVSGDAADSAALTGIRRAFSAKDERAIQKPYLIDGFTNSPVLGSGFGASALYLRSEERPWMYELTYYQMLFNLGAVGMTAMLALFAVYFGKTVRILRECKAGSAVPFAVLVAYCSLFIGAYGDPYFGGFDALFFVGLLPYIASFQHGFDERRLLAGATV